MMDASLKKKFTLKDIIFVTITDYPGLFLLSGQIKGKTGCVVCIDSTCYTYLKGSNKMVYTGHKRFLVKNHKYRKDTMIKYFNNQPEPQLDEPERASYGKKVFGVVKDMDQVEFDKEKKETETRITTRKGKRDKEEPSVTSVPFKKKSIFFRYLSYWKTLDTPHAIDCMHLKKNVFESTIGVLLDFKKKTKNGLKSWTDLVNLYIKKDIHPQPSTQNEKVDLPSAGYNLTLNERRAVC
jgi:hypothetical protein